MRRPRISAMQTSYHRLQIYKGGREGQEIIGIGFSELGLSLNLNISSQTYVVDCALSFCCVRHNLIVASCELETKISCRSNEINRGYDYGLLEHKETEPIVSKMLSILMNYASVLFRSWDHSLAE
jgi:hypothetical protein